MTFSIARILAAAALFGGSILAQGTLADYQRGQGLQAQAGGLVVNAPGAPSWIKTSDHFWYAKSVKGGTEFVLVDPDSEPKSRPSTKTSSPPRFPRRRVNTTAP